MRLLTRFSLVAALLLGAVAAMFAAPSAIAQDSTPMADDCVATTPEENVEIVTNYIIAYDNAHAEGVHETLYEEYSDNLDRGQTPHDTTTNEDEVFLAESFEASFPGSIYIINEIVPLGENRVVADLTIQITHAADPSGAVIELAEPVMVPSLSVVTIECGTIISARTVSDSLVLILGIGLVVTIPEATPVP